MLLRFFFFHFIVPNRTHCNVTRGSCDSSKAPSLTFQWMVPQYHPKFFSGAFDTPEINSTIFETSEPIVMKETCVQMERHAEKKALVALLEEVTSAVALTVMPNVVLILFIAVQMDMTVKLLEDNAERYSEKNDVSEVSGYIFFKSFTNLEDNADKLGIVCPDKTESCPIDNTCCIMSSGRYGCCPMPDATCCPDHLTCCPSQYECVGDNGCERKPFLHLMHLPIFVERKTTKYL
ncbi:Granulin [Armadillidium vulgare]|nr:Granulin [Armadillidium vulgare]